MQNSFPFSMVEQKNETPEIYKNAHLLEGIVNEWLLRAMNVVSLT